MAISLLRQKKTENVLKNFQEEEDARQMTRLAYTLLFGFFAGILGMILKKESLLYHTGFLDSYTLSPVKFLEPDTRELLENILIQRLGAVILLVILSTTYLGCIVAYLYQIWSGLAMGILAAGSMIRYGGKGILLIIGSLLPQQIIFIPAFLLLSAKCCELCKIMYFRGVTGSLSGKERYRLLAKKMLHMAGVIMVVITGCFIECYVNPKILKFILQFF